MGSVFVLYMKPLFVLINNCTAFLCKSNQVSLMALDVHICRDLNALFSHFFIILSEIPKIGLAVVAGHVVQSVSNAGQYW